MASDKTLKFFKGASAPSSAAIGAVWFDTTNRLINVKVAATGDNQWEAYSGLQNASWIEASKTLRLVKANGENLDINLSDVASAQALSTLTTNFNNLKSAFELEQGYIDTLQETVGDATKGLVKASADHAELLAKLDGAVTVDGSVKKQIKDAVDAEATIARQAEQALGLRIDDVVTKNNGQDGRLDTLEAFMNAEGAAVDQKIADAIDALAGGATSTNGALVNITVKSENGEVKTASVDESALNTRLSGIDTDIDNAVSDIEKKLGGSYTETETVAKAIQAAADAAAAAQADIDAWNAATEDTDGVIETIKELNTYITDHTQAFTGLSQRVGANETAISGLNGKVDVAKVSTAIETAKGEAIAAAAEDAATKANGAKEAAIAAAKTYTDDEIVKVNGVISGQGTSITQLGQRIDALDLTDVAVNGQYVSAVSQTDGQITVSRADLPTATVGSKTIAEGKHVAVEVVEEKGVLTGLTVVENDIASAQALSALDTKVSNLETALNNAWLWEEFA